jgi:tRNA (mo5U34)-methyltransferase
LNRTGFKDIRLVDVTKTTSQEQRVTGWMGDQSLSDFLDPSNPDLTVEGYPAPQRAIFLARK